MEQSRDGIGQFRYLTAAALESVTFNFQPATFNLQRHDNRRAN
jgi:hypothetical protein